MVVRKKRVCLRKNLYKNNEYLFNLHENTKKMIKSFEKNSNFQIFCHKVGEFL